MTHTEEPTLESAAAHARQAFSEADVLGRLFDFLVLSATSQRRPKEFEVAAAVFGRDANFDGAQDASVRVAIHRLRKKLDEFYAGPGRDEPVRLVIPKGRYRMVIEAQAAPEVVPGSRPVPPIRRPLAWIVGLLLALNAALYGGFWVSHSADWRLDRVRHASPWAPLLSNGLPTLLVVGDYYIFSESDPARGVDRLVREYGVNSRGDLDVWLMNNPQAIGRYRDLGLSYLPVGAAFALRDIAPVLAGGPARADRLRVVMASDLTSEMLKQNNIVYVGYISGLGLLREPAFWASRFKVGSTYDQLVETATGRSYVSQQGGPQDGDTTRRDFAYVTAFKGPQGNRILIIAGARDVALMHAAETLTSPAALAALRKGSGGAESFEALYEAQGLGRNNLSGRMIFAAPRTVGDPWATKRRPQFPAG